MMPSAGRAQALRIDNRDHSGLYGTVGALLQSVADTNRYFLLSAAHVLAGGPQVRFGDIVRVDCGQTVNASLFDWEPSFGATRPSTTIDAAVATVSAEQARMLAVSAGLALPVRVTGAQGGIACRLRTRRGNITATVGDKVTCWMRMEDGGDQVYYQVRDGWLYDLDVESEAGDSGAPVWSGDDGLLGIHCGLAPEPNLGRSVFIPIAPILSRFQASAVTRGHFGATQERATVPERPPVAGSRPAGGVSAGEGISRDQDILARTIWGEARGEPNRIEAMGAVACVVLNRVQRRTWWGKTIAEVCQKNYQFSCWNPNDRNLPRLREIRANGIGDADQKAFGEAMEIAGRAVRDELQRGGDPTNRATHYHNRYLSTYPIWARDHKPCATIGNHLFYNDVN